ncbi:oxidase [Truncatella angustata]|uniref:Oxidase n=1 Tax=Truncatella angustata TaxID=152316 RepID=A0A9P8UIZ3_9PEZI|nr:oxidase [Truncatella angustata]KAH6653017.1 oxidase [Truncatella angustata]
MKSFGFCAALLAQLSVIIHSFPTAENFAKLASRGLLDTSDITPQDLYATLSKIKNKRLLFDPLKTPIDVSGDHTFQAPDLDGGDQRGPCPGLNALANHGYLPHDGVVGFLDLIEVVNTVYGMGVDLITVLSVMGTAGVGNPLSLTPGFSIGGETPKSSNILGNLLGLLGTPRGLYGSHNWIEGDSSGTRDDLYVTGNAWTMNMTLFFDIYNSIEDVLTMEMIGSRAAARFNESIGINPYFYYGPYTGMVARNAGYAFVGRILSNHSTDYPQGSHMTKEVFASFFGVYEEDGQLVYKEGWEQIPENWYRISVDYDLASLNLDLVAWLSEHPVLASIGGNLGKTNSFAGLNLEDVTGGLLNAVSLLEGNNLMCFSLEIVKTFAPNSLSTIFSTLSTPLQLINDAILDPILDLSCPTFTDLSVNGTDLLDVLVDTYPGARKGNFAL